MRSTIFITLFFLLLIMPELASADTLSGENYQIKTNITITPTPRKHIFLPTQVIEKQKKPPTSRSNTSDTIQFGTINMQVLETRIDFGLIEAGSPLKRSTQVTLSSTTGYTASIDEDNFLHQTNTNLFIPDTTCDRGQCDTVYATPWESPLTFGFGYGCKNTTNTPCSAILKANTYRPVANRSLKQHGQKTLENIANTSDQAGLTFKINVPPTQPEGDYVNVVDITMLPNL